MMWYVGAPCERCVASSRRCDTTPAVVTPSPRCRARQASMGEAWSCGSDVGLPSDTAPYGRASARALPDGAAMPHAASPSVQLALTLDRGLRLEIEPGLLPLLAGWAPVATSSAPLAAVPSGAAATPLPTPVPGAGGALVRVVWHRCSRPEAPAAGPDVRLGMARGWMDDERAVALVHGGAGGWARVRVAQGLAEVAAASVEERDAAGRDAAAADLRAMCTIAVALLAGRRGGVLVAASAVIAPDGGGWLVVGEANSGKSTTVAHLVTAGWGYLADEEVLV